MNFKSLKLFLFAFIVIQSVILSQPVKRGTTDIPLRI